jgi:hypothetical protein
MNRGVVVMGMSEPIDDARAAVLAGAILISAPEPTVAALRRGPAVYRPVSGTEKPLDLDAPMFRYHLTAERIVALRDPIGARGCCARHRRG